MADPEAERTDPNDDDEQTLAEYIASLSAEDKGLITDLSLDIGELLLLDIDGFDDLINKSRPDLDERQQSRRLQIVSRISNLQAWEKVFQEGRKYLRNKDVNGNGNGRAKSKNKSGSVKSKSKSNKEEQEEKQKKRKKEYEERIAAITNSISSLEEWRTTLLQKYCELYDVVHKNLPNLWHSLEFDLSIKNILHIKDCTLPIAGIVLGKPSSSKTLGIELFRKSEHTFYTDKFSSKSFVSHSTSVPIEQLIQIDTNRLTPKN